jgi:hypothetical protein
MTVVSFLDQKPSTLAGTEATVNFQRALGQPLAAYPRCYAGLTEG